MTRLRFWVLGDWLADTKELAFCRKNRNKILRQARRTYDRIISNVSESLSHNSCDFLLLEKAYHEYLSEQEKTLSEIT